MYHSTVRLPADRNGGPQSDPDGVATPVSPYQGVIGYLMWISGATRPDISFAVDVLARCAHSMLEAHWQMAMRVVSYLSRTKEMGLQLGGTRKQVTLEGWVDADHGGCIDTRRSTTGYALESVARSWIGSPNARRPCPILPSSPSISRLPKLLARPGGFAVSWRS